MLSEKANVHDLGCQEEKAAGAQLLHGAGVTYHFQKEYEPQFLEPGEHLVWKF